MRTFFTFLLLLLFGQFPTCGQGEQSVAINYTKRAHNQKSGWEPRNRMLERLDARKSYELRIAGCKLSAVKATTVSGKWFELDSIREGNAVKLSPPPLGSVKEGELPSYGLECKCYDRSGDTFVYPIYGSVKPQIAAIAGPSIEMKFEKGAWTVNDQSMLDKLNPKSKENKIKVVGCKVYGVQIQDKDGKDLMSSPDTSDGAITLSHIEGSDSDIDNGRPYKLIINCKDQGKSVESAFDLFKTEHDDDEDGNEENKRTRCDSLVSTRGKAPDTCRISKANKFGEDRNIDIYDDSRITYIYDFNHGKPIRPLYKVYKEGEALVMKSVNPNTEKIDGEKYGQIKIVNVNRFVYDVSINDTIVSNTSEPSNLFNQLFLGDSNILGGLLESFKQGLAITKADGAAQGEKKKKSTSSEDLFRQLQCFSERYNGLHAKILQAYNPCSEFPCCNEEDYHGLANDLVDIKVGLAQLVVEESGKIRKSIEEKSTALASCKVTMKDLAAKTERAGSIRKLPARQLALEDIQIELAKLDMEITELSGKNCVENVKTLDAEIKVLEKQLKLNDAVETLRASLPSDEQLRKMVVFINNLVQQNDSYSIDIPQLDGDQLEITFRIQSRDSITKYYNLVGYHHRPKPIMFPITNRRLKTVVSFSSGSFLSLGRGLHNKVYDWQPVPNSSGVIDVENSKYKLTESGASMPVMGFAALANLTFSRQGSFSLGASVGVGITIESKPRYAYLAGLTLASGKLRQLALTLGVAVMPVEKLNNNLRAVHDQGILYSSRENIEYYKRLQAGAMVAVTYTPFVTKKK